MLTLMDQYRNDCSCLKSEDIRKSTLEVRTILSERFPSSKIEVEVKIAKFAIYIGGEETIPAGETYLHAGVQKYDPTEGRMVVVKEYFVFENYTNQ